MRPLKSLLIAAFIAHVSIGVVLSSPVVVPRVVDGIEPLESSGGREASGPEFRDELQMRPSIIPHLVPRAADFDIIDIDHDGRVTSEEWRKIFIMLLAIYDSNGDQTLSMSELLVHNLTPPLPTTHLVPPPSKRGHTGDFKGQLAREHDHVTRKKEQLIRQRDQLYVRDRNAPRSQHRHEQRMQGRP